MLRLWPQVYHANNKCTPCSRAQVYCTYIPKSYIKRRSSVFIWMHTCQHTHKWVFSFWDVCFLCEYLKCCPELDIIIFVCKILRCQAALRALWTACVICATLSMVPWQKQTCSVDAVRGGRGYFEHCSASSTSTLPSSTYTLPSCALLWVVCVCLWVCDCQHVCR